MSLEKLRTLANQEAAISNLYLADKLQKLGMQEKLNEMYKPLIESSKSIEKGAEKNTERIINKIEEVKNEKQASSQARHTSISASISEIRDLLAEFPNVVAGLKGEESIQYSPEDIEVIEGIDRLPSKAKRRLLEEIHKESIEEGLNRQVFSMFKAFEYGDQEEIDKIVKDEDKMNLLLDYAAKSDVSDFMKSKYYRAIEYHKPGFVRTVLNNRYTSGIEPKSKSKPKRVRAQSGEGLIRFLPSSTEDLVKEMNRLLGSYKAGNKNTFNEISAISDVLRRRGVLKPKMLKQLYKHLKR
jgi:hypothetical protein